MPSPNKRRGWAEEAQAYNGLVLSWGELEKLAGESGATDGAARQADMFEQGGGNRGDE